MSQSNAELSAIPDPDQQLLVSVQLPADPEHIIPNEILNEDSVSSVIEFLAMDENKGKDLQLLALYRINPGAEIFRSGLVPGALVSIFKTTFIDVLENAPRPHRKARHEAQID